MSSIYFEQIDLSYFTTNAAIGGNTGGREFTFNAGSSNVAAGFWIRSVTFWVDGNCMRGCEMWLNKAGGATQLGIIGQKAGNQSDTFVFGDGERLTSLKLWGNGYRGGRFSAVEWTTSENRTFKFGHLTSTPTYQPDIGSGFLVGLFGRHAADIDCLGFAVLRRIKNTRLLDLVYPNLQAMQVHSAPESIKTIRYDNSNGAVEQEFTFSGEMQVWKTSKWSITAGVTIGFTYEVEGKLPLLSAKATTSVQLSVSGTYESSTTTRTSESFSFPVKVPAGKIITATATLYEANIDTPFTAVMVIQLDTGKQITYNVDGSYKGVDSDKVEVRIEEE